MIYMTGDM